MADPLTCTPPRGFVPGFVGTGIYRLYPLAEALGPWPDAYHVTKSSTTRTITKAYLACNRRLKLLAMWYTPVHIAKSYTTLTFTPDARKSVGYLWYSVWYDCDPPIKVFAQRVHPQDIITRRRFRCSDLPQERSSGWHAVRTGGRRLTSLTS